MPQEVATAGSMPPPRDGVNPSRVRVRPGEPGTVLAFLQARFLHATDWPERLQQQAVLNAAGQPVQAATPCPAGTLLWYWRRPAEPEPRVPFEVVVLHQCARLVVVNKPPFLAVTPSGRHLQETVLVRLQQQLGLRDLSPLHRVDRDTAGVLAFSADPASRAAYQALWRERQVHKVYEAVVLWRDDVAFPFTARHRLVEPHGEGALFHQMQVAPGEPNAETLVELLQGPAALDPATVPGAAPGQPLALLRLTPVTGRKHQLRAQLAALGLPIVGDRVYPVLQPEGPDDFARPLQLLARHLAFRDPVDGSARAFESALRLGRLGFQAAAPDASLHTASP
ncbi:MAG: pseudouridine synthase [Inhella sp.]|jgi:tRNA pseudouridine32 synthase/23S rRNA pseudouridine746 synthase|uniref:pseudouridine synthase n=1 Tax=Inhella sp. TaxID=1921806 RepID=UPI00391ACC20